MQKYNVSNQYNEFSEQLYPIHIDKVEYINFVSNRNPYGFIQIHGKSVDGIFCTRLLKCYLSKKGKYTFFGGRRIYVGYKGPVELIGVPSHSLETVKLFASNYGSICS